jgi:alkanesulfonate monooxygenase SsuD/methylene tetrahydromethanopterin reductase-like flavin-dependent oxidoreductase (luciferase family)
MVPAFGSLPLRELTGIFQQQFKAFVGTADELIEYIRDFAAAGADEVMLQWISMDDLEGLTALAEQVRPAVAASSRSR